MRRPSLADVARAAAVYRYVCATGPPEEWLSAYRYLCWVNCRAVYGESVCRRRGM